MSAPKPSPDAGRVRFRKLRIAWSVACLVACGLLIVLWVQGFSYQGIFRGYISNCRTVASCSWRGWIEIEYHWFNLKEIDVSILPKSQFTLTYHDDPLLRLGPGRGWGVAFQRHSG